MSTIMNNMEEIAQCLYFYCQFSVKNIDIILPLIAINYLIWHFLKTVIDAFKARKRKIDENVEDIIRYQCLGREARVSKWRVEQAVEDRLYREGLMPGQIHGTGSVWEGLPDKVCNDQDYMLIHKDFPVVVHQQPDVAPPQGFLIYNINHSNPAFLTLRTVPGVEYDTRIQASLQQSGNQGYLSSYRFVTNTFRGAAVIQETHGPAGVVMVNPAKPEEGTGDAVPCLSCPSWPPYASEFLTRPRQHGWPPQSLIDKIQQAGCHVVPVGHPQSQDKDIEWRWSFSTAEKELIHKISDKMYMVMYALKAIKNQLWRQDESEVTIFCSYFIKTACLWVCEENDQSNISMMGLCRKVIDWLVTCYRTHKLPHYFIPEQNLIGHLEYDFCNKVVSWLGELNNKLSLYLLKSVSSSEITRLCDLLSAKNYILTVIVYVEETSDKIQAIKPGGHLYIERYRWMMARKSNLDDIGIMYYTLEKQIQEGTPASVVVSIPENILLPILSDLSSIVLDGCCDMFTTGISRYIGLLYSCLYTKYKQSDVDIANICKEKAISYHTEGFLEMVYPDGWSDRGLGGYVRLATFYHLNGEREKLGETLEKLEPLLEWGRNKDVIRRVGFINIVKMRSLSTSPWKQDQELYTNVIEPRDDWWVHINPVVLGYYLLIRWLMDDKSQEEQTSETRHKIQEYLSYIETIITGLLVYTVRELESAESILRTLKTITGK